MPDERRRREWAFMGGELLRIALGLAPAELHGVILAAVVDRLTILRPGRGFFVEEAPTYESVRGMALRLADAAGLDLRGDRWTIASGTGLRVDPLVLAVLRDQRDRPLPAAGTIAPPFDGMLGWGWWPAEPWGAWSRGTHASIELGAWRGGRVAIGGRPFTTNGPARVGWSLDGDEPVYVESAGAVELEIDAPPGTRRIHLHLPDATSPAVAGVSADERVLGFGLESVKLA
jgi:hypothetical protein